MLLLHAASIGRRRPRRGRSPLLRLRLGQGGAARGRRHRRRGRGRCGAERCELIREHAHVVLIRHAPRRAHGRMVVRAGNRRSGGVGGSGGRERERDRALLLQLLLLLQRLLTGVEEAELSLLCLRNRVACPRRGAERRGGEGVSRADGQLQRRGRRGRRRPRAHLGRARHGRRCVPCGGAAHCGKGEGHAVEKKNLLLRGIGPGRSHGGG